MRHRRTPLPWPSFVNAWRTAFVLALVLILAGLSVSIELQPRSHVLLATTTSPRDSGLLDYLTPFFLEDTGMGLRYTAVGTGQALDLGRRGDADVVLVHEPDLELAFLAEGHGRCRSPVMMNEFVIVGPADDPAGIRGLEKGTVAFSRILAARSMFISRGDNSGTHVMEKRIWSWVGTTPSVERDSWYKESGQGMLATLRMASELRAYTLTDDGTFLVHSPNLNLELLVRHDPPLQNLYSVIPISPQVHPSVNADFGLAFARWIVSARGQDLIGRYTVGGESPFRPVGEDRCT